MLFKIKVQNSHVFYIFSNKMIILLHWVNKKGYFKNIDLYLIVLYIYKKNFFVYFTHMFYVLCRYFLCSEDNKVYYSARENHISKFLQIVTSPPLFSPSPKTKQTYLYFKM